MALIHHEVGTHLVTQVNGMAQPVKVLGTGLAGYDETRRVWPSWRRSPVAGSPPFACASSPDAC